jgi:hypothetical protein
MSKPSERIVVFVTPAQKRAITASAENLGISVSELMRRAVLSFGATSEQVKAASIVDRLRAPREPDALNEALQRVARASRHTQTALPAALQARKIPVDPANEEAQHADAGSATAAGPADKPLLPAGAREALARAQANGEDLSGEDDSSAGEGSQNPAGEPLARADGVIPSRTAGPAAQTTGAHGAPQRPHVDLSSDTGDDSPVDPAPGDGRFA